MKIDNIDKSILKLLQNDCKLTIKEIANKLNLTPTPIFERIKRLEKEEYIMAYKAVVNRKKIGLSLLIFCNISLNQHEATFIAKFEKDIQHFTEVIECYHIGGMFDYLIKVVVEDMDTYQYFVAKKLASIENIGQVQSSFVMTEVKSTASLPII
jgi:DNA-binding Lrp family transcriptional regulator